MTLIAGSMGDVRFWHSQALWMWAVAFVIFFPRDIILSQATGQLQFVPGAGGQEGQNDKERN